MANHYLVTGCAGFIGARVAQMLLDAGHVVAGCDNLSRAYDPRLKEWRLTRLQAQAGFSFTPLDVTDRQGVLAWVADAQERGASSGLVHLAARAGVRASVADPWAFIDTNVTGTLNVLDACRQHGVGRIALASSSSLYGDSRAVPFTEEAEHALVLSPYAASKAAGEALAHSYHHLHGLNITALRFFTVYGPAGRPDMSVFRFVRNICEGQPITVYGDGSQQRDFTYVDDIARGVIAALELTGFHVINLGGDRPIRLDAMIALIEGLARQPARIEWQPPHPADAPATWANIDRARSLLHWQPTVPLEKGLQRTVQWYQQHRDEMHDISLNDA